MPTVLTAAAAVSAVVTLATAAAARSRCLLSI
jgi:hypothetical protein